MPSRFLPSLTAALALTFAPAVLAQTVTLTGGVTNSCTISLSNNGTMVLSNDGTRMGSEEAAGGSSANFTVVAAGATPTIKFSTPVSSLTSATAEISFSSTSGASQAYTSSASQTSSDLLDSFAVEGRLSKSDGFPEGTHTVTTNVTCEQS